MFRVNWHFHSREEVQNRFSKDGHLGFWIRTILAIFIYKLPRYFLTSFESTGLLVKMFKPDFPDGGHGSHFGFCIGTSFIIFYVQVALIFPTKFRVDWPLGLGEIVQNRFLRRQRWWPFWISNRHNFSNFLLTSCPDTSYQISSQLAFWFRRKSSK